MSTNYQNAYIAHKTDDGKKQLLREHLENVAELSESYAQKDFKSLVHFVGLLHDIGKYSEKFQWKICGDATVKVEHAVCGSKEFEKILPKDFFACLAEFCIMGHHTGLPDGGAQIDGDDMPTLAGRMKRPCEDYSAYKKEIETYAPDTSKLTEYLKAEYSKSAEDGVELYSFFTRYIYSCLVDADFIDTERVFNPEYERGVSGNYYKALELLNDKMNHFKCDTAIRAARSSLQKQALHNSINMSEIALLNMPTGSGKTLCSIKIALEMAIAEGKKHIIYVIPYTSIIEQTANTFMSIFGKELYTLQHHSNYTFDKEKQEDETTAQKMKRTCENWDAPLIVTTSVQFFQSLYHYKSSHLRKLHNLTDSIIIFDEIHMIPTEYLQPCIRAVGYITRYLNSKAIFLSATMPDYGKLFSKYIPDSIVTELIKDKSEFVHFNKCVYRNLGETSYESVIDEAQAFTSALIVVNTRKAARDVYNLINGKKFHLSTYMTPSHRADTINKIKVCLDEHERVTVVSTSLVEAGVDLDFEAVFRQLAGLDNIIQTAGRCNREGKNEYGSVFIFSVDERVNRDLQPRIQATKGIMDRFDNIASKESIQHYYNEIFSYDDEKIQQNSISISNGRNSIRSIPFRTYAESFKYISSDTIGIIIPTGEAGRLLAELRGGRRSLLRELQPYTVSVYIYELENMIKMGTVEVCEGAYILSNLQYYTDEIGLNMLYEDDERYII